MTIFHLAVVLLGAAAGAPDTPEAAIHRFEDALKNKDIEAAVAVKDFHAEAQLMLQKINPEMSHSDEIVKQTAEVLELGFRKEIETDGFPDFKGLTCSLSKPADVAENLVKVPETCVSTSGRTTTQNLYVFKNTNGWRMVVVGE